MLEIGQTVKLDNDKEYVVINAMNLHNVKYVFLATLTKPLEIEIAVEKTKNNKLVLEEVKDNAELDYILSQLVLSKENID